MTLTRTGRHKSGGRTKPNGPSGYKDILERLALRKGKRMTKVTNCR